MEEMLNQVGNIGFPIVVSIYLLVRFEKKIDILTKCIDQLGSTMEKAMTYQKQYKTTFAFQWDFAEQIRI